ncbi:MAG: ribonuclease III [candidate division Zixibacteria bacterium 4484_95]|nr:MAG: ribonuclease III [candidate division Zixibacteria bacterium 4484_95]RKX20836.1 MAG: ribonuclease III [candidate division Zixibacteria bacterium]
MRFFRFLFGEKSDPIARLEKIIGYRFHNRNLIKRALSHRSSVRETGLNSNERLEFLGDAVLGMIVSLFLFNQNDDLTEGELTQMKAALVNEKVLSKVALSFGLGNFLFMSPEEEKAGGRLKPSITADAFEALIGAIYLDGGYKAVDKMVKKYILNDYLSILEDEKLYNYKGELLEFLQARGVGMPYYKVDDQTGPDHDKIFYVGVYTDGEKLGEGMGKSKKEAEQKAARRALIKIKTGQTQWK